MISFKNFILWFKKSWYLFLIDYLLFLFSLVILIGGDYVLNHPNEFPFLQEVITIGNYTFTYEQFIIHFWFTIWIFIFLYFYFLIHRIVFNAILKRKPTGEN